MQKFSDAQNFLEHQRVRLIFISLVWDKRIRQRYYDIALLWVKFIDMSEISETLNGLPTKILSNVSEKKSTENCVIAFLCTELSDTRK